MEITKYNLLQLTSNRNTVPEIIIPQDEVSAGSEVLVGGTSDVDSMEIGGKSVDLFGNVSDTMLEQTFLGSTEIKTSKSYKSFSPEEVSKIKRMIWNMVKKKPASEPSDPSDPYNPSNPSDPSDPTDPSKPPKPSGPPDDDGNDTPPDDDDNTQTVTLTRKGAANKSNVTVEENKKYTLVLENTFDNKEYKYTLESKSGSNSVAFEYLDNGRLFIQGDNIKVVANDGQDDDIVLIGSNNDLKTGNGCDTVRVGFVGDAGDYQQQSDFNNIDTGSGDDYVISYGYNNINAGTGTDKLYIVGFKEENYNPSASQYSDTGVEKRFFYSQYVGISDNKVDGGFQGQYGDCKLLSFINSLNAKGILNQYVSVSSTGSGYKVVFPKSGQTVNISNSDLGVADNADGDIDFVLIEIAFRKIIEAKGYNIYDGDKFNEYSLGNYQNNFLISYVFFGDNFASKNGMDSLGINEILFNDLFEQHQNGTISNLVVGTGSEEDKVNQKLGIVTGHAYAVVGGVKGKYVELVNPWDGNDKIRLDWSDLFSYFSAISLFGNTFEYVNNKYDIVTGSPNIEFANESATDSICSEVDAILAEEKKQKGVLEFYS